MDRKRHRLAERRRVVGLSQEGMAEAIGVDRSTVARWERGETDPQPWHRLHLANALQVSVVELHGLLADVIGGAEKGKRPGEAPGVKDRVPALPAAVSFLWLSPETEQLPGSEVYAAAMQSFRAADRQVGGGYLYATVVGYLHRDVAPQLFRATSGGDSDGVFSAAAALTEMAGWMAHDAGRDEAARQHFARSLDLAQVGNDRQLTAHILASMSHLAHHQAQPEEAIGLARRGQDRLSGGPRQPELEARLLAMEARGLAAVGHARECTRLLGQAEKVLGEAPGEAPSPWVSRFDEAALANETARSLVQLGDLNAAGRQAERIIALRAGDRTRSRAFGQLILVTVLLSQGRLEEACGVAQEVLGATRHLGSYLVVRELLSLRQRVAPQRDNAAAGTFLNCLEEALRERRWLSPGLDREGHEQPADTVDTP